MTWPDASPRGRHAGGAIGWAAVLPRSIWPTIAEGVIVTILPDAGDRYFSTRLWEA